MKRKKLSKKIIFAIVCAAVIGSILIAACGLQIAFVVADKIECWRPSYAQVELDEILAKDLADITEEEYQTLYEQTGLTEIGIRRAYGRGTAGKTLIKTIQRNYFEEHAVKNDLFAPFVCTDYIEKAVTGIYLEDGDIIVTSSTHISGVRIGHSGLVVNGTMKNVLQANAYGAESRIESADDFFKRVNFMVLKVKDSSADAETKKAVVDYAMENLVGLPYEGLAGLLTNKNKINKTQCAHLVWYAYKQAAGIDIDGDGGLLVTPKDIASSKHIEVVQVFGFDPVKLWK
ncbi:MAG: hypothetical protein K2H30_03890 [Clostridia bacterium]|nr:hypothetical protein [Clostridia bacterium]